MSRKLGAIRQLSLQCEPTALQSRRSSLKKQHSEDAADDELAIRVSVSAKGSRTRPADRPPPTKLAWTEKTCDLGSDEPEETKVIIKECKGVSKGSFDAKDSILCPRNNLADRLRQAWRNDHEKKQNLNIVLAPNSREDETLNGTSESVPLVDSVPKITPPLQPDFQPADLKNIFQKQLRKNNRNNVVTSSYSPTRSNESVNRSNAIVVVPFVERAKPLISLKPEPIEPQPIAQEESKPHEVEKPIEVIVRPSTATSRRELFQKRTNSAFHGSVKSDNGFRPPLVRASSVPNKPDPKSKFLASKRRIKHPKRKDTTDEEFKHEARKDIVTMVSLVSPSGSDNDDETGKDTPNCKIPTESSKTSLAKKDEIAKNFSLRKVAKQVSFQQSSIHSIRSFSASFPSRRGSVATTLLLGNASKKLSAMKHNEKRTNEDGQVGPKRRLVRSASVTTDLIKSDPANMEKPEPEPDANDDDKAENPNEGNRADNPTTPDAEHPSQEGTLKEESPKEKECWNMFCKMNERGVAVSFDTILRGMLTPTEYRLRKKLELAELQGQEQQQQQRESSQDNC